MKCPECNEGEVVERRSKRGKTFYGCNRWPDCNFVTWGKPVQEKCPECGGPYMVEKWLKAGPVLQCPNAECKHKQPMLAAGGGFGAVARDCAGRLSPVGYQKARLGLVFDAGLLPSSGSPPGSGNACPRLP